MSEGSCDNVIYEMSSTSTWQSCCYSVGGRNQECYSRLFSPLRTQNKNIFCNCHLFWWWRGCWWQCPSLVCRISPSEMLSTRMTGGFSSLTARSDWILVTDVVGRDLQDLQSPLQPLGSAGLTVWGEMEMAIGHLCCDIRHTNLSHRSLTGSYY